jgi:hypothetical protein
MTLRPQSLPPVPETTVAAVQAAFPTGNLYVALRAEFAAACSPMRPANGSPSPLLAACKVQGWIKVRGTQRTDPPVSWKRSAGAPRTSHPPQRYASPLPLTSRRATVVHARRIGWAIRCTSPRPVMQASPI